MASETSWTPNSPAGCNRATPVALVVGGIHYTIAAPHRLALSILFLMHAQAMYFANVLWFDSLTTNGKLAVRPVRLLNWNIFVPILITYEGGRDPESIWGTLPTHRPDASGGTERFFGGLVEWPWLPLLQNRPFHNAPNAGSAFRSVFDEHLV